ncbi:Ppx/GppA family phosphatase [Nakamurella silvestris]|nr:Ppx/GppA family phosphatase [Nakamurella silvestris]
MRLGVLDVGSNTVHLLVVDAHRGAHPEPLTSHKTALRLAEHIDADGRLSEEGTQALIEAVGTSALAAARAGCDELLAFATSAVRDATNAAEVLAEVLALTAVDLRVLPGEDEARLTFLAVRRWLGFSAGTLLVLDIGGGSLEIAAGPDEEPDLALSIPIGAGRMYRRAGMQDPPTQAEVNLLSLELEKALAPVSRRIVKAGPFDRVVGTSKTFRTMARLTGAAPYSAGPRVHRELTSTGLEQAIGFISRIRAEDLAGLGGVSPDRAPQLTAGALIARAAMSAAGVQAVEICPWALREGVILRRLDQLALGQ